ncbi:unnamed protein product, partial [Polarella glacialis]
KEDDEDDTGSLSFNDFAWIAEECRKLIPVESRRQANFMEEELATIKSSFEDLDPRNQGFVSLGELIMTLGDSHLPVNTREGRAKLLASIDLARE